MNMCKVCLPCRWPGNGQASVELSAAACSTGRTRNGLAVRRILGRVREERGPTGARLDALGSPPQL